MYRHCVITKTQRLPKDKSDLLSILCLLCTATSNNKATRNHIIRQLNANWKYWKMKQETPKQATPKTIRIMHDAECASNCNFNEFRKYTDTHITILYADSDSIEQVGQ
eukprot:499628_1